MVTARQVCCLDVGGGGAWGVVGGGGVVGVFFFNDTATTEIYTLSLHDALPIFLEQLLIMARHRVMAFSSLKKPGSTQFYVCYDLPVVYEHFLRYFHPDRSRGRPLNGDRKSTRLNSSHVRTSRMPSSA